MNLRSLEQDRAAFAWDAVKAVKDKNFEKDYKSLVKKVPVLIMTNGLGNTLGYLKSKGKKHHEELIENINRWATKREFGGGDTLKWIVDGRTSSFQVMQASREVLCMLNWLKRFATAELEGADE